MTARRPRGVLGGRLTWALAWAGLVLAGPSGLIACTERAELIEAEVDAEDPEPDERAVCGGETQCSDGVDRDGDGYVDLDDPHCGSCYDDNEAGFSADVPGHSPSAAEQGCFFVGYRGQGETDCRVPTCCYDSDLDETPSGEPCGMDREVCSGAFGDRCVEACGRAAPPGCDCAGCCTVCSVCERNADGERVDPECDPADLPCLQLWRGADWDDYPDCDPTDLRAEDCPTCEPYPGCGGPPCEDDPCVRCSGQQEEAVGAGCAVEDRCPGGVGCEGDGDCGEGQYCGLGCCLDLLE